MAKKKNKKEGENLNKKFVWLLGLLVALNSTDIITTVYGLSLGAGEFNPLFSGDSFVTKESLIIKIGLPLVYSGFSTITYGLCKKENYSKGFWLLNINLLFLVGFYTIVVTNNLLGIIMAKVSSG
ncbi:hypothetical protein KJA16_00735 [Patescibacteria group bacterium]|nr:hypothetical protein [Patescibacteria group bacterium]MBZ9578217.1 hypothetical protein [Patescibacteria group bacterium]